jgi:hypothetical protein
MQIELPKPQKGRLYHCQEDDCKGSFINLHWQIPSICPFCDYAGDLREGPIVNVTLE